MKVLIIGSGGREHALAWKAAASPRVEAVYVAPGNAGTALEPKTANVAIPAEDIAALVAFAAREDVDLTLVGPEAPLCAGIVDAFEAAHLRCFGPHKNAAILEGSKSFTKAFMARHGIPTAGYAVFTEAPAAVRYIERHSLPVVVKAAGLAAGKGVVIATDHRQAIAAAEAMLSGEAFGAAGREVVIEEFIDGEEASYIVITDGKCTLPLASCQDHKARDAGDTGPNTGGMGAYSPAPVVNPSLHERILREVIDPTLAGMAREQRPYRGFLYAGLMISADGAPRVLEFNCRFGDPEAQVILLRLKSDLISLCEAAIDGDLGGWAVNWDERPALGVVLAAGGYPGAYEKGDVITGLDRINDAETKVFHAGTATRDGRIVTSGGRVLCVSALGDSILAAQRRAYAGVAEINWRGMFFRPDIGRRAVARGG